MGAFSDLGQGQGKMTLGGGGVMCAPWGRSPRWPYPSPIPAIPQPISQPYPSPIPALSQPISQPYPNLYPSHTPTYIPAIPQPISQPYLSPIPTHTPTIVLLALQLGASHFC